MFAFASVTRRCHRGIRSIVCLSLCAALPMPPQASPLRALASRPADAGPGWYDSSWDLVRGLDIAEVPDLEAELALWIEACLQIGPAAETA